MENKNLHIYRLSNLGTHRLSRRVTDTFIEVQYETLSRHLEFVRVVEKVDSWITLGTHRHGRRTRIQNGREQRRMHVCFEFTWSSVNLPSVSRQESSRVDHEIIL